MPLPTLSPDPSARLERALVSLDGLSLGDAFGDQFFALEYEHGDLLERRVVPGAAEWTYTDDTEMSLAIVEVLRNHGTIHQEALADRFARRYVRRPMRGYGAGARAVLSGVASGLPFREAAGRVFGGNGSYGNGAAMRVGPLGAYFADSLDLVVEQARLSAEITHAHPEGQAGAIAIAVAAAVACRAGDTGEADLLGEAIATTPPGPTRDGLVRARGAGPRAPVITAAQTLGVGWQVTSADTVPFCLWAASRHLRLYEAALWTTVSGMGDRDTTCAIVGGIVAGHVGREGLPAGWLERRERLEWLAAGEEGHEASEYVSCPGSRRG